jgi:phospholipid/cholesterol/gamma-HCH transport system ATP-binding protein
MIRIRNLWKRYGNVDVLAGLNLDVEKDEILVILGRSGAGKSVLLRHIIGLETPDRGTIEVDNVLKGMLFQSSALFDSMSVKENTAFYLRQHGTFSDEEIDEHVHLALKKVDLEGSENKMPSDLSGGMRKRAGLARLLVYRPSILLYDEPTTGLDPITAKQIGQLILQTQQELCGTSIVVTHDVALALTIGDRLALHLDGKIAHIATPQEFIRINDPIIQFFCTSIKEHFV